MAQRLLWSTIIKVESSSARKNEKHREQSTWEKRYTAEERAQALKLAEEIGGAAAARRLGINEDTLYGWRGRERKRAAAVEAAIGGRSEAELLAEVRQLRSQLQQARQYVEILQEALGFFVGRRKP